MYTSLVLQLSLLITVSCGLYILSRRSIQAISNVFYRKIGSETATFWVMSLIFLPGTIVHEMSHFLAATILFLKVRDVGILPVREGDRITLGHVFYEKKDLLRSILVGIAPFFGAIGVFLMFFYFRLFPNDNIPLNLLYGYLVFAVSTMMFSSKQDMKDAIYILPFLLIAGAILYVFNIDVHSILNGIQTVGPLLTVVKTINLYLLLAVAINIIILGVLKGVQLLLRR